jgi:hypothetical protein
MDTSATTTDGFVHWTIRPNSFRCNRMVMTGTRTRYDDANADDASKRLNKTSPPCRRHGSASAAPPARGFERIRAAGLPQASTVADVPSAARV